MAHRRRPLQQALAFNTVVLVVEILGGISANSLSLVMDGVHNLSDELAIAFLVVAYTRATGISSGWLRAANLLNAVGLLGVCGWLIWHALGRLVQPMVVLGWVPIIAGVIGAACNWGVAWVLRSPSREDPSIRLAYVHNLGDTFVSLVPVLAGVLTLLTRNMAIDPLLSLVIAVIIVFSTVPVVLGSHRELLWPERVVCGGPPAARR